MTLLAIPDLPVGSRVSNHLYASPTPDELTQNILTVRLPNDCYVDVGWYPENDPAGEYYVRVFRHSWNSQLAGPFKTRDARSVISLVQQLAHRFNESVRPAASSNIAAYVQSTSVEF